MNALRPTPTAFVSFCLSLYLPIASVAAADDPCANNPHCFNAGSFLAEVVQVQPSAMGNGARNHSVTFNVRFRNISDKPVILAYRSGSASGMDNFGNAYGYGRPNHDSSAKGIGVVDGRNADPQFTLSPGQTRSAVFDIIRFNARPPVGTSFNYNLVIEELRVMADQTHSLQTVRQNSLSFTNLVAGTSTAANLAADTSTAVNLAAGTAAEDPVQVAAKVIGLFKKAATK